MSYITNTNGNLLCSRAPKAIIIKQNLYKLGVNLDSPSSRWTTYSFSYSQLIYSPRTALFLTELLLFPYWELLHFLTERCSIFSKRTALFPQRELLYYLTENYSISSLKGALFPHWELHISSLRIPLYYHYYITTFLNVFPVTQSTYLFTIVLRFFLQRILHLQSNMIGKCSNMINA